MKAPSRPNRPHGPARGNGPRGPQRPATSAGLPARLLAADALDRILRGNASLETPSSMMGAGAPRPGARLPHCRHALRRLGTLRAVLTALMERGAPKSAPKVETVLLVGAAQILFMDVPDHAAVGLSVDIARGDNSTAGFAGLINAVLRRLAREREERLAAVATLGLDTPEWLRQRWTKAYGPERAKAITDILSHEPALDITVKSDAAGWAEKLGGEVLPTGTVRVLQAGAVRALPVMRTANGGCRTRPPRCPRAFWAMWRARASRTSVPRPAARPPSSPPPGPR